MEPRVDRCSFEEPLSEARKELAVRADLELDDIPFSEVLSILPNQQISIETQLSGNDADFYKSKKDLRHFRNLTAFFGEGFRYF